MSQRHLFISYSHTDWDYVAALAERLEAAGIEVWCDRQLKGGFSWSQQLEDRIRQAHAVLVVLTPASSASEHVRDEIHFAKESAHVPMIVPLLRRECNVPLPLTSKQWLDARGQRGLSAELIAEIKTLYEEPAAWSGLSPHDMPWRRRAWPAWAGALGALILCVLIAVLMWMMRTPQLPTVVLMDSAIPRQVYDDQTRAAGGTNADDITNVLKDLPIRLIKETTSLQWSREEQVRQVNPQLIVMHLSCFYSETNIDDSDRKFWSFIEYMCDTDVKFIVYSRGLPDDPDPHTLQRWNVFVERIESESKDRMKLMVVGRATPTFRHPVTARKLKSEVKATLRL